MYAPSKLSPPENPTKRRHGMNFVSRNINTVRCLHRQRHPHVRRGQTHTAAAGQQLEGGGPLCAPQPEAPAVRGHEQRHGFRRASYRRHRTGWPRRTQTLEWPRQLVFDHLDEKAVKNDHEQKGSYCSPMHEAIRVGDEGLVSSLVEQGASVNDTLLHLRDIPLRAADDKGKCRNHDVVVPLLRCF